MVARLFATSSRTALKAAKANLALNRGLATAAPAVGKVKYVSLPLTFPQVMAIALAHSHALLYHRLYAHNTLAQFIILALQWELSSRSFTSLHYTKNSLSSRIALHIQRVPCTGSYRI
jgi:hypothetical protein